MRAMLTFIGFLILIGLLARYYKGATAIIRDTTSGAVKVMETLQMKGPGYEYGR